MTTNKLKIVRQGIRKENKKTITYAVKKLDNLLRQNHEYVKFLQGR